MCIAILTTPGKVVDDEVFKRCWKSNPHGFGIAYISKVKGHEGTVQISKGYMNEVSALKSYHNLAESCGKDNPMLLHFRAATVGAIGATNCHPFPVKDGAMIHNGTFFRDEHSAKSDSCIVAETMHDEFSYENLIRYKKEFDDVIGYNRVAFLFKGGKFVIFSEDYDNSKGKFGQWKDGIWYSNGGWKGAYGAYYGDGNKPEDAFPDFVEEDQQALAVLDTVLLAKKLK